MEKGFSWLMLIVYFPIAVLLLENLEFSRRKRAM